MNLDHVCSTSHIRIQRYPLIRWGGRKPLPCQWGQDITLNTTSGWRWTGDCTKDHSCSLLGESEQLFQSKCYWGQRKECYPVVAVNAAFHGQNVAWVFQEHYNYCRCSLSMCQWTCFKHCPRGSTDCSRTETFSVLSQVIISQLHKQRLHLSCKRSILVSSEFFSSNADSERPLVALKQSLEKQGTYAHDLERLLLILN